MRRKPLGSESVYKDIDLVSQEYASKKREIGARLEEFRIVGQGSQEQLFIELCFCILTPQSRARSCDTALNNLIRDKLLFRGSAVEISRNLKGCVRFHNQKARFIVAARHSFLRDGAWTLKKRLSENGDSKEVREWLVGNVLGLGYKEATHFLRNIGMGDQLAILDRHIMKNLHRHGILKKVPSSLTRKEYLRIEDRMREFSEHVGISLAELDLLFWSRETGEVFK